MKLQMLAECLSNLVVFDALRSDPLIRALAELYAHQPEEGNGAYAAMCAVARALYPSGDDLTSAVFSIACRDENLFLKKLASGENVEKYLSDQATFELDVLAEAASYDSEHLCAIYGVTLPVAAWRAERREFYKPYISVARAASRNGYGIFARSNVFSVSEEGCLVPVRNPDPQRLSELYGYAAERRDIILNTKALLAGRPANNVLLYGDAGTGKSSTVKAIANEYAKDGLRLIQVEKSLLHHIPALLDSLAENPLKFIIFIDDLSFASCDRDFTALKTVLEGSVAARAKNTVVYATSNRRHLLRETFSDRQGGELHYNDTVQETTSLAARFGLTVTFEKPGKEEYLALVKSLAAQYGLAEDAETLCREAEAFAIMGGGRSPRIAKQFVEYRLAVLVADEL
ncbi:MAG: ATP-binding protein [Oscillospiraceae bacterium]